MATSLCNTVVSFQTPLNLLNPLRSKRHFSVQIFNQTSPNEKKESKTRMPSNTRIEAFPEATSTRSSSAVLKKEVKEEATTKNQPESELDNRWPEIHGANHWEGLLDPMDSLLRKEILRYGEMTQNCYDSFEYDVYSRYYGSCRYPREKFFEYLGKESCGYEVTRYLYATANIKLPNILRKTRYPKIWSNKAHWMGYVSVSNDEKSKELGRRDIAIAWRGTVTGLEWMADLSDILRPISSEKIPVPDPQLKVESGFLDIYADKDEKCRFCKYSAREQILTEVKRLIEMYPNEELSITVMGHSLGSALATLSSYDIAEMGVNKTRDGRVVPITVFSFAGPRVGNLRFKERIDALGVKVLRVLNVHDVVPKSPGFFFNENLPKLLAKLLEGFPWFYSHVGVELQMNSSHSPFLRDSIDAGNFHNLEALLHLLDGYIAKGYRFASTTGRDIALVNKSCDFLKDEHYVPPIWMQDRNKGMVLANDGRWVLPTRPKLEDHPEETHHHLKELGLAK